MYVISVEQLLSKVVETYLSEKHALEKQLCSSLDVPVAAGDVESHLTPATNVQPSSTVTVEPSTDDHLHSEEQKECQREGGREDGSSRAEGRVISRESDGKGDSVLYTSLVLRPSCVWARG